MEFRSDSRGVQDLLDVVRRAYVWHALALADVRSRYRLSALGSLWITVTTGALALMIGVFYGQFFGLDTTQYLPYFVAGYIVWSFIAGTLGESSTALLNAGHFIKSSPMPIAFYPMRLLHRNLIVFGHNILVLVGVWLFMQWPISPTAFASIPALVLLYLFLVGIALVVAIVSLRYRDVPALVQILIQLLFFLTPVMWLPDQLRFGELLLQINPVTQLLILVRDPLLGRPLHTSSWLLALLWTGLSLVAGAVLYVRKRDRIAYWI